MLFYTQKYAPHQMRTFFVAGYKTCKVLSVSSTFAKKRKMKKRYHAVFFLISIFALSSCTINNVKTDDGLQKIFAQHGMKGTFAVLDNAHGLFTVCDLHRYKDSAFAPGATFDIVNTLISLETGRLTDENSRIKNMQDSVTLKDAFKQNNDTVFRQLALSVGKDTMQHWIDSLHYGNVNIHASGEPFWTNDSLKITPDEQLGFVDKLYFSSLPFQKRVMQIVQRLMLQENNTAYSLAYKTSVLAGSNGRQNGWALGWVEENRHVYFFVMNAESIQSTITPDDLTGTLKSILTELGFLQGKK